MDDKKCRLYIAYGSNLNLKQMPRRCPSAEIVGTATLHNWRLRFRGGRSGAIATIEHQKGCKVPVLVWRLQPSDERALDSYEGWPYLYRKEQLQITINGKRTSAMVYIMNEVVRSYNAPSDAYFDSIYEGYKDAGFDTDILFYAAYGNADGFRKPGPANHS